MIYIFNLFVHKNHRNTYIFGGWEDALVKLKHPNLTYYRMPCTLNGDSLHITSV